MNPLSQKSGKVGFPPEAGSSYEIVQQNSLFTENLNGPSGPDEHLLRDISPKKSSKVFLSEQVFDEKTLFAKVPC